MTMILLVHRASVVVKLHKIALDLPFANENLAVAHFVGQVIEIILAQEHRN